MFYYVMELADADGGGGFDPAQAEIYRPRTLRSAMNSAGGRLPLAECLSHAHLLTQAVASLHAAGLTSMLPLTGSPAIDKGKSFPYSSYYCPSPVVPLCTLLWEASEQRGTVRTVKNPDLPDATGGDGTDIGAAEIDRTQSGPTFMVTNPGDHDDGTCSFRDCTLREAIHAANNAAPNAIMMDPWFLPYVNGISLNPALGTLIVTDSISITGPGARKLYVSGEGAVRVFEFISSTSSVSGLTIASGAITGAFFGVPGDGGGVLNTATLTLTDCTFIGNEARGGGHTTAGGSGGYGGVINCSRRTPESLSKRC